MFLFKSFSKYNLGAPEAIRNGISFHTFRLERVLIFGNTRSRESDLVKTTLRGIAIRERQKMCARLVRMLQLRDSYCEPIENVPNVKKKQSQHTLKGSLMTAKPNTLSYAFSTVRHPLFLNETTSSQQNYG